MRRIVFDEFGDPSRVLRLDEGPLPDPPRGCVRVRMLAAPINPSDLMLIRGGYSIRPELPATPGLEGVGVVEAAGGGLLGRLMVGRRVALPGPLTGTWAEFALAPSNRVIPVPAKLSDAAASTFFINPATALILSSVVLNIPPGGTLVQTAAASAVGLMVVRLGRRLGFRTVNVVHRADLAERLLREGVPESDILVSNGPGLAAELRGRLPEGVVFAIDPVGGGTASELSSALGRGGRLVLYGTLSGQPAAIDPRHLMTQGARVEGFWLSEWMSRQSLFARMRIVRRLGRLVGDGTLGTEIAATYPLTDFAAAVEAAQTPGRAGKVVMVMAEGRR
jgi:NADPH:quinone reductase-like Zn-dependent oxidoreductase